MTSKSRFATAVGTSVFLLHTKFHMSDSSVHCLCPSKKMLKKCSCDCHDTLVNCKEMSPGQNQHFLFLCDMVLHIS
jgi:hypothetical protein